MSETDATALGDSAEGKRLEDSREWNSETT